MVQAPPRYVFNPAGNEQNYTDSAIVSVAPQLPYYVEVRTSSLNSFLQAVYKFNDRNAIQKWLEVRQRTGFYFEITQHLHIAFADQRDGANTQYWWFIYYDKNEERRVFDNIKVEHNLVKTKLKNKQAQEDITWNNITFSSKTEKKVAQILYNRNIIFFANLNGFMDVKGLPVANPDNKIKERAEVDFLVFYNQKCMILEVDGEHHNSTSRREWDYKRDRIFLKQGITTVRFSAEQCHTNASAVVDEFLALFN